MSESLLPHAARRSVLAGGVGGLVAGGLAAWSATASAAGAVDPPVGAHTIVRPFRGPRQAGIVEAPQTYAAFVSLRLARDVEARQLKGLFVVWTDDIERLVEGRAPLTDMEPEMAASPAALTITVGVGRRVVALAGKSAPEWLGPLPAFPKIDHLEERWSGGDLLLQICAASPTSVAHAQRRLIKAAGPLVTVAWVQRGFREAFTEPGAPMRNLMGQVDGIVQPATHGPDDALLFCGPANSPDWLHGGSGLVIRRIAMNLDVWDRVDLAARENAIGRRTSDGQPLAVQSGSGMNAPADLERTDALGFTVIDPHSHLARSRPVGGTDRFLRRPYSYDDAPQGNEVSNSGLIFVAYAADVAAQFVPVQKRLAESDLLNLWTTPIGSAVFAVLPGALAGESLGEKLFA